MRIAQLEYFISVAEHLSFTKAAEECHIAQPAISQQIQVLEQELGYELFHRSSKGVALTEAGEQYYQDVLGILSSLSQAEQKAASIAAGDAGSLTFGISSSNQINYIRVIESFQRRFPEVSLVLRRMRAKDQYQQMKQEEFDVTHTAVSNMAEYDDVTVAGCEKSRLRFAMSVMHPLSKKRMLTLDDIKGYPHIMAESKNPNSAYEVYPYLSEREIGRVIFAEDQDISWLLVKLGLGIAAIPEGVAPANTSEIVIREVAGYAESLELGWAFLKENKNPALKKFLEYLEQ